MATPGVPTPLLRSVWIVMTKPRFATLAFAVLATLSLLTLVLFNRGVIALPSDEDDEPLAELATRVITRKDLRTFKDLDGILEYGDSVQMSAGSSGVLTYVAPEGSQLDRGDVVYRLHRSVSESERSIAEQQVASANTAVAQSELALESLHEPPTVAQIVSADAAVDQAELSLANLNAPAAPG